MLTGGKIKYLFIQGVLVLAASGTSLAQPPDSLYKVNDTISSGDKPRKFASSFDLKPVTFDVDYNYKNGAGGMIGGRGSYFHGRVTVAPTITFDTATRVLRVNLKVTGEVPEERDPGNSLAQLTYQLARQDVSYAEFCIRKIKVYLGNRDTIAEFNKGNAEFVVAKDITTFKGLEVLYRGDETMVKKTIFFGDTHVLGGTNYWPWIIPVVVLVGLGAATQARKKKKQQKGWVEIALVDELQEPVAGEQYRIVLPDGTQRTGRLDSRGRARIVNIPEGNCQVSFPNIDESEWREMGTSITERIET